jgi:hypothetical protein
MNFGRPLRDPTTKISINNAIHLINWLFYTHSMLLLLKYNDNLQNSALVENNSVSFKVELIINYMVVKYNIEKAKVFEANAKFIQLALHYC